MDLLVGGYDPLPYASVPVIAGSLVQRIQIRRSDLERTLRERRWIQSGNVVGQGRRGRRLSSEQVLRGLDNLGPEVAGKVFAPDST